MAAQARDVVAAQARRAAAETAQVCDAVLIGHHGVAPEGSRRAWPSKGCKVRMTDFWSRLEEAFGPAYSRSLARDQAFTELGGRTIDEAIAQGVETVTVWRAVVATFPDRVPSQLR